MSGLERDVADRLAKLYREGRRLERIGDTLYVLDGPDEHDWSTLTVQELLSALAPTDSQPEPSEAPNA